MIYNDVLARYPEPMAWAKRQSLMPRIGRPSDVASLVVFLAADESAYITGRSYAVDGGHLAHQPQMADMRSSEAPELPLLD